MSNLLTKLSTSWFLLLTIPGFTSALLSLFQVAPPRQAARKPLFMATEPAIATAPKLQLVHGIRDIIDDYDVFVLDMWGVMHDGFNAYEGVIDCVAQLRQAGKQLIILSNSSQRKDKSIKNLQGLGFDPANDFTQIITSGEVAFQLLSSAMEGWDVLTKIQTENSKNGKENKIFVLGSEIKRDVPYVESSGWKLAPMDEADLILASGTFSVNDGQTEINKRKDKLAYELALKESLEKGAARRLPMIVSNPDKIRPDFERPPMPGKIGDMYEQALVETGLGEAEAEAMVKRIGKPFRDVYDLALQNTPDKSRACMVGDALETDITGGTAAGIDTIWILKDGVYMPELEEANAKGKTLLEAATEVLQDFNASKENTYAKGNPDQLPTVALPHFKW
jgi:HAD superfamily hydrolase (TIGR01450 family)